MFIYFNYCIYIHFKKLLRRSNLAWYFPRYCSCYWFHFRHFNSSINLDHIFSFRYWNSGSCIIFSKTKISLAYHAIQHNPIINLSSSLLILLLAISCIISSKSWLMSNHNFSNQRSQLPHLFCCLTASPLQHE